MDARQFHGEFLTGQVEGFHHNFFRTRDGAVEFRQAQAAFFSLFAAIAFGDLRIDEDLLHLFVVAISRRIDDEQPVGQRDLIGGKADATCFVHQLKHLLHPRLQLRVNASDVFGFPAEGRMRVVDDLQVVHGDTISTGFRDMPAGPKPVVSPSELRPQGVPFPDSQLPADGIRDGWRPPDRTAVYRQNRAGVAGQIAERKLP